MVGARAWLVDRSVEVDAARRTARISPMRWPALLFVPAFASTPASLAWVQFFSGTAHLTTGGWVFMVGYAALTVVAVVMFLRPSNRRVAIDFDARRISVGGPYGIGDSADASFADAGIRLEETVRQAPGRAIPRAKVTATVAARTYELLDLANEATALARALRDAVTDNKVERLEAEAQAAGAEQGKRFVMLLGLMVLPGLMFAWAALR